MTFQINKSVWPTIFVAGVLLYSCNDTALNSTAQTAEATKSSATLIAKSSSSISASTADTITVDTPPPASSATIISKSSSSISTVIVEVPPVEDTTQAAAPELIPNATSMVSNAVKPSKWIQIPNDSQFFIPDSYQIPYALSASSQTQLIFTVRSANTGCSIDPYKQEWVLATHTAGAFSYEVDCTCLKIYPGITSCNYIIPAGHRLYNEIQLQHRATPDAEPDSVQLYFIQTQK